MTTKRDTDDQPKREPQRDDELALDKDALKELSTPQSEQERVKGGRATIRGNCI